MDHSVFSRLSLPNLIVQMLKRENVSWVIPQNEGLLHPFDLLSRHCAPILNVIFNKVPFKDTVQSKTRFVIFPH